MSGKQLPDRTGVVKGFVEGSLICHTPYVLPLLKLFFCCFTSHVFSIVSTAGVQPY